MDRYEIPHQIRHPEVRTLADNKISCPTIINERALRSRERKPSAATLRNHMEELGHWQKLRKKFSRENLNRTEKSKQNSKMSGEEIIRHLMENKNDMLQNDVEVPLPATVLFPAPEQRTASDTLTSDIKMDISKNEETDLQEMTSMSTIDEPAIDDSYTKCVKANLYKSNIDSDHEDNLINLEEKKSSKVKLYAQDTHSQLQREMKLKIKYQRANENHSSNSENDVSIKRKKCTDNSQKRHYVTNKQEEPGAIEEVNIAAESDDKCTDNSWSENDHKKTDENKKVKLTRSRQCNFGISGDEDYCFSRTPTPSLTNILYELCIKQTTASNMAMVFPFVMLCSVMLWIVNSLYYYTQFSDPLEEKYWYEAAVAEWIKLLKETIKDYLESIIFPVPVQ